MPAVVVTDCPHCSAAHATFTARGEFGVPGSQMWRVLLECPVCHAGVVAHVLAMAGAPSGHNGPLVPPHFQNLQLFPTRPSVGAPENVPDEVKRLFIRATEALRRHPPDTDSAAMLVRKCLEVALAQKFGATGGRLVDRIDKLVNDGQLTREMATWAHGIRLDGNEAAHEATEPDVENTRQLLFFLQVFLLYVFTLPAMVAARHT